MFKDRVERFDIWDIGLIKLTVALFVLGLIAAFPVVITWVQSVNPFYFLVLVVAAAFRPTYRFLFKRTDSVKGSKVVLFSV